MKEVKKKNNDFRQKFGLRLKEWDYCQKIFRNIKKERNDVKEN